MRSFVASWTNDRKALSSGRQFAPDARTSLTAGHMLSAVQAILFFLILTKEPR